MGDLIHKHHISFKNAFAGLKWAFSTQPNFKVHFFLAFLVIGIGIVVELTSIEWVIIVFCIFWALAAEMINTAIESVCDLVTNEWKKEIKIAKDVSAGMMLLVAIGTVVVAGLIVLPKLFQLL